MARRKRSSKNSSIITLIVFAGAALLFLFAGVDPLGMFGGSETAVPAVPTEAPSSVSVPAGQSGASGDWWQVYFTDPARFNDPEQYQGSIESELIALIDNAQFSIHIASFEFNLTPVAEALIAAHERGVDIRWVTDDEHGIEADEEEGHGQFAMLEDAGIQIKDDQRSALMHNKFWIFDREIVWTGSTNITENGIFRNNNNVIVIESPVLAEIYETEFAEMWAGEFGPRSPSTALDQTVTIDGTFVRAVFAAEDEAVDWLLPLVQNAESSIYFMAFSFTQDDLGDAILERARDGLDVRGIFETRGSQTEYSELIDLYCSGFPMRQDGNPGTFHHKVIVIDKKILVTGSLNFSDNANDSNDENLVIVNNPDIAELYLEEFDRRWAEGKDPDPAELGCR